ncbi:chemotaxis protein CheW [Verrucomicrobium sp. BvORR106]|uniref:chemotaxis protein CheW n=1 Tax=Verrucomicrobium sp. BvORR106 TaxID=1403819 RepID=UPI000571413D|nr:chemotaxis protein CheW [Verrucomicrobium sp. BvORR106]
MLLLVFQLGQHRFALDTRQVAEVLPLVQHRPLPQAPAGVAGVFAYHGRPVPLIDLAAIALGEPSQQRMSTRIILVNYADGAETHLLGLLAEKTTETLRRTEADFAETGVRLDSAPYLGPVTHDARGMIQRVEVSALLSEEVRAVLFRQPLEVS